jgi:acyl-coenzyme A synthetase/AMP-(fatty) acid ligase
MVRASRAALVLTDRAHFEIAETVARGRPVLLLEDIPAAAEPCPIPNIHGEHSGFLLFTSGTTGVPKGLFIKYHDLVTKSVHWVLEEGITGDDRVTQLSSLSFTLGIAGVLCTILGGATACLYDLASRGIHEVPEWMRTKGISMIGTVPSTLRTLADAVGDERIPSVHTIKLVGETAYASDVHLARRVFGPDVVFINQFGSSEVGSVAWYIITPDLEPDDGALPAGSITSNVDIVIVDDDEQPVPPGEIGRIIACSDALATSRYWDDPELTNEVFFTTPEGREGARMSDAARIRPDGLLEHIGRIDSRVKVRGAMVATSEVERAFTVRRFSYVNLAAWGRYRELK